MGFDKEFTIASILAVLVEKIAKIWTFEQAKTCNANLERVIQGLETFYKIVLCEFMLCGTCCAGTPCT